MMRSVLAVACLVLGILFGELSVGWLSQAVAPAMLIAGIVGVSVSAVRRSRPRSARSSTPR
jgi:hypothetical protein